MNRGLGPNLCHITSAPRLPTPGRSRRYNVSKAQVEQQNAYLEEEVVEAKAFGDLVGQSSALRHIVSQIDLVAPTDASVLILGETGTGQGIGGARNPPAQPAQRQGRSSASIAPPSQGVV